MFGARAQRRVGILAAMLGIAVVGSACASLKGPPPPQAPTAAQVGPGPVAPASTAAIVARVNEVRAQHGLAAYTRNSQLDNLAQSWSAHMASTRQFGHRNLQATIEQPQFAGFQQIGENILRGACTLSANEMVGAWMNSPGHRANVLSDLYEMTGVGVVCDADGMVWVTQNFGALR